MGVPGFQMLNISARGSNCAQSFGQPPVICSVFNLEDVTHITDMSGISGDAALDTVHESAPVPANQVPQKGNPASKGLGIDCQVASLHVLDLMVATLT